MHAIAQQISDHIGRAFSPDRVSHVGGGCINDALLMADAHSQWFVKCNAASRLPMFEAEADGLRELHAAGALLVPEPLCTGLDGQQSFIVMQWLELGAPRRGSSALAGRQLAALHRQGADRYGWTRPNTIGATPQPNDWRDDWRVFWQEQRLGYQLQLAAQKGCGSDMQTDGERLLACLPVLLDHAPCVSLLHGDLWSGNVGYDRTGTPVLFDPAVYYGDREADVAMTELFGGFDRDFYSAYNEAWPLDSGYRQRKTLYNLYHVLNHANLFGGGYLSQAQGMMRTLLAEC
jgi:protein-ribulosamine 3-kinase